MDDRERELRALVEARRELGAEHEEHLITGFLDRIDREIDRRVDERLARRGPPERPRGAVTPLVLGSIALGIPVTAVALSNAPGAGGIAVAIIAWIAIALANLAAMFRR